MAGLIDSKEGLAYGEGLIFEVGLGGASLTNPLDPAGPSARVSFSGTGSMSVVLRNRVAASARFAGSGGASADTSVVT